MLDFLSRRSIRKFKDISVEKEKVDEILKAVLTAPTGRNSRPCEFVVINDKDVIKSLDGIREHGASFLKDAPLVIGVMGDSQKSTTFIPDCSIAAYTIQLKAHDLGLGSCWIHMLDRKRADGTSSEEFFKEKVGAPNNLTVLCLIAIGYPDENKPKYTEENMDFNKVSYNRYGNR